MGRCCIFYGLRELFLFGIGDIGSTSEAVELDAYSCPARLPPSISLKVRSILALVDNRPILTIAKMPKRKSNGEVIGGTPKKNRNDADVEIQVTEAEAETPSKQRIITDTPSKQRSILKHAHPGVANGEGTPRSLRKVLFSTPAKARELEEEAGRIQESPLTAARNADRSARRKSTRKLFSRGDDEMDDEEDVGEDVAQKILDSDDDQEEEELDEEDEEDEETIAVSAPASSAPDTPTKHAKLRGRPKGKRRARSPTPPEDLPPHELYFFQNRPGGVKTSINTLPSNALLDHDDYFAQINAYKDAHQDDVAILSNMHKASFEQWTLELSEAFNICLYGYGSKRPLLLDFADYLYAKSSDSKNPPNIVVVNGYNPSLTLRDILTTLSAAVLPASTSQKLPLQPTAHLDALLSTLAADPPITPIYLFIHSIDAAALRKHQMPLSRLASCPHISVIASADTLTFPLLWDISLRSAFKFLFHDTTTFIPYTSEMDPVEEVNALLGRSGRRVGGKDGVAYVLRSLPENARNLYRILVAEQLALADSDGDIPDAFGQDEGEEEEELLGFQGHEMDLDNDINLGNTPSKSRIRKGRPAKKPKPKPVARVKQQQQLQGVEYRTLYHKAVEEFVCSSEMSFRTLLKEFHDHDMLESRKDGAGTERLSVPFGREELEEILGELV